MRSDGMNRDVKVVCIGDSITEGYGVEAVPGPYPEQLKRMLGEGFQVYNQGVSCTCTTCRRLHGRIVGLPYILEKKWEEALSIPGDIYIVMLGDAWDERCAKRL